MSDYVLIHHGIKGQRWGVRRFQNKDGSLTAQGRSRYSGNESSQKKPAVVKNENVKKLSRKEKKRQCLEVANKYKDTVFSAYDNYSKLGEEWTKIVTKKWDDPAQDKIIEQQEKDWDNAMRDMESKLAKEGYNFEGFSGYARGSKPEEDHVSITMYKRENKNQKYPQDPNEYEMRFYTKTHKVEVDYMDDYYYDHVF